MRERSARSAGRERRTLGVGGKRTSGWRSAKWARMIAVVDYHLGNLTSVERGIACAGGEARVTDDPADIAHASGIVLPGVGAFAEAARFMERSGQMAAVRERIVAGTPFLGICLGMHLMYEEGVEGVDLASAPARGLGVLPGVVTAVPAHDAQGRRVKIPHVGWNSIEEPAGRRGESARGGESGVGAAGAACGVGGAPEDPSPKGAHEAFVRAPLEARALLAGIPAGEWFYFTHGFAAPEGSAAIAHTVHATRFPSIVWARPAAWGVQFHPEKSSEAGIRLLANFVEICARRAV